MAFLLALMAATGGAAAAPPAAAPVVDCVIGLWDAPPTNAPTCPKQDVTDGAFSGNGDLGVVVGANGGPGCKPPARGTCGPPTTLGFYMDLMQFRTPHDGHDCVDGAHVGVGWLGVNVTNAGSRTAFAMQQMLRTAEVTTQSTFSSGIVLHSRLIAYATENLAVVELWYNKTGAATAGSPPTLSLGVSDEVYGQNGPAAHGAMECRTNQAGQHTDPTCRNCSHSSSPPWQWAESWLGRGYQDHRAFTAARSQDNRTHHDALPLTSRVEHVTMGTGFGGEFIKRTNAASNSDGHSAGPGGPSRGRGGLGTRSWSTVEIAEGKVLRLSTQLWTERDFAFARDPMAAVTQSMGSVADPAHITKLEAAHAASWTEYWARSAISMPSSRRTELFWYGALYMWQTANLYNETAHMPPAGLWKNHYTGNDYGWPAYTTDINTQAPYYAVYSSNHQDVASAMYQLNIDYIPPGQMFAQYNFKCPGVLQMVEIGARGEIFSFSDQGVRSNALLSAMLFVMHWEYTLDVAWLRTVGYVYLKEVAAFWSCYLVRDEHGTYLDINDCCYEVCGANDYPGDNGAGKGAGGHLFSNFEMQNNPANSLGMLKRLYRTMLAGSTALGIDADLRAGWQDILDHLVPLPLATVMLDNKTTTILADFDGAGPPPKNDRQMLSAIQPIFPAGQFYRSMPNRTEFALAVDTMRYLDYYSVPADTFCIMYTISGRVGANQTVVYPQMVETNLQWPESGGKGQTILHNLMTGPQIGPAALVYVNELFVQSHESFVRIYPSHFTDTGAMGGPPRGPAVAPPSPPSPPSPPPGTPTAMCMDKDNSTCAACTRYADKRCPGPWCGPCVHLSSAAQGGSDCVPAHWWNKEKSQFPGRSCTGNATGCKPACASSGTKAQPSGRPSSCDLTASHAPPERTQRPWLGSSFQTLRAQGAFLVSGSLSESGVVAPFEVHSERGRPFVFLTPWPKRKSAPRVVTAQGTVVATVAFVPSASQVYLAEGERLYRFETQVNGSYTISSASAVASADGHRDPPTQVRVIIV
jgi:hypothetical protein